MGNVLPFSKHPFPGLVREPDFEDVQDSGGLRKVVISWKDGAGTEHERAFYQQSAQEIYAAVAAACAVSNAARVAVLIGIALGCMLDGGR